MTLSEMALQQGRADQSQREARRSALLLSVAGHILEAAGAEGMLARQVFEMVRAELDADILLVHQARADGTLELVSDVGVPEALREAAVEQKLGQFLCSQSAARREPLIADHAFIQHIEHAGAACFLQELAMRSYACHPLLDRNGRVLGTFAIGSTTRAALTLLDVEFLQTVSNFLALAWSRQCSEQAMRRSEAQHRHLLESITDGFYAVDRDWRITYLNPQAERLMGRSRQELLGRHLWQEFAQAPGSELQQAYQRALDENITVSVEACHPPNGRWYVSHAYPSPGGLSVYFRDVSEAKRAEHVLQETRDRLQLAHQVAHVGTFELDLKGRITLWSPELEALHGMPAGTFDGSHEAWAARVHPADLEQADAKIREALVSGSCEGEWRVVWPDGRVRWIAARAQVFKDETGRPARLVGANIDITERKQAEEALRRREQQLQTLVDNAPLMLTRYDRAQRYVFVNRSYEQISRLKPQECLGRTKREVGLPAELCAVWEDALEHVFRHRRAIGIEFQLDRGDGHGMRYFEGRVVPEFSPDGEVEYALGVTAERTQEKLAQEALREADRRKDEFLATLAHELRNPLAPVRTGLQILQLAPIKGAEVEKALEMMERQVSHMVCLVDDLLDVSRISRGKIVLRRERLTLRSVLDSAIEASHSLIKAGRHELAVQLPYEPIHLDADPTRLSQVLSNLLNNAAKYTPEGGRIHVSAGSEAEQLVIRVRDNGVGIAPEMLPKVFDLFTQAGTTLGQAQGGLGIGLSISRNLVEMHQGSLEVESRGPGHGAVFTVRLPRLQESAQEARPPESRRAGGAVNPRRVLVVDDNADAADSLAMMLRLFGHETRTAYNGQDALLAVGDFRPWVVFCDIGMPGMNGYEVARRLRSDPVLSQTLIVALTGWGSDEDKQQAREAGFDLHLTKPVKITALQEILAQRAPSRRTQGLSPAPQG